MKNLIIPCALLITGVAQAQEDTTRTREQHALVMGLSAKEGAYARVQSGQHPENAPDTLTIRTRRKIYTILTRKVHFSADSDSIARELKLLRRERRNMFCWWAGVELGLDNFMAPNGGFELPEEAKFMELRTGRSRFFAINFMEQKIEFGSHHAGLFTGLGVEFRNYMFANNVTLAYDADSVYAAPLDEPTYTKNKLRQIGLRLPLLFEFNTARAALPTAEQIAAGDFTHSSFTRKHNFHLGFGVIGSWYFDTMHKVKYRSEGELVKERSKGDFHMLPYRLAGRVQLGYASVNLFAEYAFTPFFEDGKGPELMPVSVGITLVNFN